MSSVGIIIVRVRKFDQMQRLVRAIQRLRTDPEVARVVEARLKEFEEIGSGDWRLWARELAFCILAANFKAVRAFEIATHLWSTGLLFGGSAPEIENVLRRMGHRFPKTRARFIVQAMRLVKDVRRVIPSLTSRRARDWLRREIPGLGMKEASHFLRNTGRKDVAIIDRHILRIMRDYALVSDLPKSLTVKRYLELEGVLRGVAVEIGLTLAELDLYMWCIKTGFVFR